MRMIRLFTVAGCLAFSLVAMGCESSSSAPTPTPTPTPAPTPTPPPPPPTPPPTPPPATPATLSAVSLSTNAVPGQSQPQGTVTLTAAAPAGGAVVRLESSRSSARVPSSVTVPAGQTTATFTVDTATVDERTDVTITATYADTARTVLLTVLLPRPRAIFTVTSPTLGQDACALVEGGLQLDCRLDGKPSEGRLVRWAWNLEVLGKVSAERPDPAFNEIDVTCNLVDGASTSSDNDGRGRYANLKVTLEVTDKEGDRASSDRTIKLYTRGFCGF